MRKSGVAKQKESNIFCCFLCVVVFFFFHAICNFDSTDM